MIHITADERLLRLLASLAVTPQGQAVLAWLKQLHVDMCAEFPDLRDEISIRQAQGAAQMIKQLTEAIESAPLLASKQKDHGR